TDNELGVSMLLGKSGACAFHVSHGETKSLAGDSQIGSGGENRAPFRQLIHRNGSFLFKVLEIQTSSETTNCSLRLNSNRARRPVFASLVSLEPFYFRNPEREATDPEMIERFWSESRDISTPGRCLNSYSGFPYPDIMKRDGSRLGEQIGRGAAVTSCVQTGSENPFDTGADFPTASDRCPATGSSAPSGSTANHSES